MSNTSEESDSYEQHGDPPHKRQRTDVDSVPYHLQWTSEKIKATINSMVKLIVVEGLSFDTCDRTPERYSAGFEFIRVLNPAFATKHLPTGHQLAGQHFDSFYESTRATVKSCIQRALRSGFCSLILSGWDKGHWAQVVNVLLRTPGSCDATRNTFFLKSLYTGLNRAGGAEHVRIIESIMKDYGGMEGICSVTSDMSSTCFNVKEALIKKYPRLVGLTDQTTACDELTIAIASLPWMIQIISNLMHIVTMIFKRPKLTRRFQSIVASQNKLAQESQSVPDKDAPTGQKSGTSKGTTEMDKMPDQGDSRIVPEPNLEEALRTFATYGKGKEPGLAGIEESIEAFLQSFTILRKLVQEPDFCRLLSKRKELEQSQKTTEAVVKLIKDTAFESALRDVQKLLLLLRTYRRIFDEDTVCISEVLTSTLDLEKGLASMPITEFFTEKRKTEVLKVFKRMKDGETGKRGSIRLLEDVHVATYLLHPHLAPDEPVLLMTRFRAHVRAFAVSKKVPNVDSYVTKMVLSYFVHHAKWMKDRLAEEDDDNISMYKGDALLWWNAGNCTDPELFEFAVRALSCSPKAIKEESTDYYPQKQLGWSERESLSKEKVQKVLFCRWNIRMLQYNDLFTKDDFLVSVRQALRAIAAIEGDNEEGLSAGIINVNWGRDNEFENARSDSESDSECDSEESEDSTAPSKNH